jgi:divalent metal cation (Fe/Co/Zn/Cd) transporter
VWLSAIVLIGLVANATLGWWWADPVAAFAVVYVAATEARKHWQADQLDDCC